MFTVFLKEMRQLRRDRTVLGVLIAQVVLSLLMIVAERAAGTPSASIFGVLNTLGSIAAFVVVSSMALRWSRELHSDSLNPCRTTPIPAPQLAAGKVLATFAGAAIPLALMLIAQLLHVDRPPAIFWNELPLILVIWMVTISAILALASMRSSSAGNGGSFLIILPLFIGVSALGPLTISPRSGLEILRFVVAGGFAILFAFAMMTAALAAPRSDRAFPIRIVLTFAVLALPWILALPDRGQSKSSFVEMVTKFYFIDLAMPIAFLSLCAAAIERRRQSRRVEAEIARFPVLLRPLRRLFSTGAFPEIVFSLLMLLAALAAHGDWSRLYLCDVFGAYTVCGFYTAATLFLLHRNEAVWHRRLPPAWGIWILLFILCNLTPAITGNWGMKNLSHLSPFRALIGQQYTPAAIITVTVLSLLLLVPVVRNASGNRTATQEAK